MHTSVKLPKFRANNMRRIPLVKGKKEIDENTPIYKIMKLDYVLAMINNKKLRVDQIIAWDDPYENVFLKQKYQTLIQPGMADVSVDDVRDAIYGQSWSLKGESDAMWRIYSHEHKSVRIKTTIGKLFDVIYTNDDCMVNSYIGIIDYTTKKDIVDVIKQYSKTGITIQDFAAQAINMSFVKRNNFSHEQEVRILKTLSTEEFNARKRAGEDVSYLEFDIIFNDLIDEICLDPVLSLSEVRNQKKQLRAVGVDDKKIKKSVLYTLPKAKRIQII